MPGIIISLSLELLDDYATYVHQIEERKKIRNTKSRAREVITRIRKHRLREPENNKTTKTMLTSTGP